MFILIMITTQESLNFELNVKYSGVKGRVLQSPAMIAGNFECVTSVTICLACSFRGPMDLSNPENNGRGRDKTYIRTGFIPAGI